MGCKTGHHFPLCTFCLYFCKALLTPAPRITMAKANNSLTRLQAAPYANRQVLVHHQKRSKNRHPLKLTERLSISILILFSLLQWDKKKKKIIAPVFSADCCTEGKGNRSSLASSFIIMDLRYNLVMSPKKATPLAKSLFSWTSPHRFLSLVPLMANVSSPVIAESGCMPAKWQWFCKISL